MKARLTDKFLNAVGSPDKQFAIYDTAVAGFKAAIMVSGSITFQLSYRNSDGKRQTYTIGKYGSVTTAQARAIAERKLGEVKNGVDVHAVKKEHRKQAELLKHQTLGVFFEERYKPYLLLNLKSGQKIASDLERHFVMPWRGKPLQSLNNALLTEFASRKIADGLKPDSVNRPIQYLRAMLNRAALWEVIPTSPLNKFKLLRVDTVGVVRFLDEVESDCLVAALAEREERRRQERLRYISWCLARQQTPPAPYAGSYTDHVQPLVMMALHTGMRRGELFSLRWGDVDLGRRMITVQASGTKSGRTRYIPINSKLNSILRAWQEPMKGESTERKAGDLVFQSRISGDRIDNIDKAWANLLEAAKIENFRFHDLRHTFASRLAMAGVDLYTIKELLGHQTFQMTQRYAHLSQRHLSDAVALLD